MIKSLLKKIIPSNLLKSIRSFQDDLFDNFSVKSYSQEGEDLVLSRILGDLKISSGFYVDIGAHHPARFSNTNYFYRQGWCGLNVDALPGTKKLFHKMRPRDITLECGVGSHAGVLTYFIFNEPALNTFSELEATKKNYPPYHILHKLQVPVRTLKDILDENVSEGRQIDFMTIDVEGFDHEVIISNDWVKYRPRVVMLELLCVEIDDFQSHATAQILMKNNYRAFAKTYNTYFFVANEAFPKKTN